jgi:hypothetical protein
VDTIQLEKEAENYISSILSFHKLLVAKPQFDKLGADLLCFAEFNDSSKFFRIQCKGRSLLNTNRNRIDVYKEYNSPTFALILYLKYPNQNEGKETIELFCFFHDEINNWKDTNKKYYLELNPQKFLEKNKSSLLTRDKMNELWERIQRFNNIRGYLPLFSESEILQMSPIYEIPISKINYESAIHFRPEIIDTISYDSTSGTIIKFD